MIRQGRLPGPVGASPTGFIAGIPGGPGRLPGVLGIGPGVVVAQVGATGVVHKLPIPRPFGSLEENKTDFDTKDVHVLTGKLFNDDKKPLMGDVKQGIIGNCALASILAAHANTKDGKAHIVGMVKEYPGVVVETDLSATGPLANPPTGTSITSNRYFTVTLGGKTFDVSDVFYTNDGDGDSWSLLYMGSKTGVVWPSVVEKALAVRQGGYHKLGEDTLTAQDMWEVVTGKKPVTVMITKTLPDADILKAARDAAHKPTIAGSNDKPAQDSMVVNRNHGFVLLGVRAGRIDVHDPALVRPFQLTMKQFRDEFEFLMWSR